MKRIFRRALVAASSLGVVGGIALTALPASAAPPPIPVQSWGASAFGPIHFGPVAYANSFHTPGVASNANYTNFLTTGMIVDRASFTTGYSLVNSPLVQLNFILGRIQASQISSWCHLVDRGRFAIGGSYIYNGSVTQNGSTVFNPIQTPHPNTVVFIHGALIVFNQQHFSMGRLTVEAIHVYAGPESLALGVTSCAIHKNILS
jgi:hypothetical protein